MLNPKSERTMTQKEFEDRTRRLITVEDYHFVENLYIYNRENETYNFLKRNVQFSLFFHPIKAKAFNHHLSGN